MAQTGRTQVVEALKRTFVKDRLEIVMNDESVEWNMFSKKAAPEGGGRQFLVPVYDQLPEGWGGITEGGTLPTSLAAGTAELNFSLQEYAGRYELSWKLIDDARNNKQAFERAVELMDRGFRKAILQDLSADLSDDGRGRLGLMSAADNTSPITTSSIPKIRKGMVLDIMDDGDDDTKHLDSGTVTDVDPIGKTVTISGTITGTGADDYLVREDSCDDSLNDSLHLTGVMAAVSAADPASVVNSTGYGDLAVSGNSWHKSANLANGGTNRALTEDLLLQGVHAARAKGNGKIDKIYINPSLYERYHELLANERFMTIKAGERFAGKLGPKDAGRFGDTGKAAHMFDNIAIHVSLYAPANMALLLDSSEFTLYHGKNKMPAPVSQVFNDVSFFRDVANTASFEVAWWWQGELVCCNRAAQVRISDLAES